MAQAGIRRMFRISTSGGSGMVAACTDGAFLATHSVSAAVHAHPRNLTDRQFAEIRDRGGLVG